MAIREVLRLAERFGYTGFITESDYKEVIDQLKSQFGTLGSLWHIHEQIFSLVDRLIISLSFVRCKDNVSAHPLAAKAISTYPSNIWMEVMPSCISTFCNTMKEGRMFKLKISDLKMSDFYH